MCVIKHCQAMLVKMIHLGCLSLTLSRTFRLSSLVLSIFNAGLHNECFYSVAVGICTFKEIRNDTMAASKINQIILPFIHTLVGNNSTNITALPMTGYYHTVHNAMLHKIPILVPSLSRKIIDIMSLHGTLRLVLLSVNMSRSSEWYLQKRTDLTSSCIRQSSMLFLTGHHSDDVGYGP